MTKSITFFISQKISPDGSRSGTYHNILHECQTDYAYSGHYKYLGAVPETRVLNRTIKTTRPAGKQVVPDEALMVLLGGPFQQVGEEHEAVGGENQKVG